MINFNSYEYSESYMGVLGEWDSIRTSFLDYLEKGIELVNLKQDELRQKIKTLQESESGGDIDSMEEDAYFKGHYFEITFLNAGLMFLISQFEYYIKETEVGTNHLYNGTWKKPTRYNDAIFKSAISDIKKIAEFQNEFDSKFMKQFNRISDYHKIKNLVSHHNGRFDGKVPLQDWVKKYPSLQIFTSFHDSYLILTKEFVLQVELELTTFLTDLIKTIYDRKNNRDK